MASRLGQIGSPRGRWSSPGERLEPRLRAGSCDRGGTTQRESVAGGVWSEASKQQKSILVWGKMSGEREIERERECVCV